MFSFIAHDTAHSFQKPNIGLRNAALEQQAEQTFPEVFERLLARQQAFGLLV